MPARRLLLSGDAPACTVDADPQTQEARDVCCIAYRGSCHDERHALYALHVLGRMSIHIQSPGNNDSQPSKQQAYHRTPCQPVENALPAGKTPIADHCERGQNKRIYHKNDGIRYHFTKPSMRNNICQIYLNMIYVLLQFFSVPDRPCQLGSEKTKAQDAMRPGLRQATEKLWAACHDGEEPVPQCERLEPRKGDGAFAARPVCLRHRNPGTVHRSFTAYRMLRHRETARPVGLHAAGQHPDLYRRERYAYSRTVIRARDRQLHRLFGAFWTGGYFEGLSSVRMNP